MEQNMRAAFLPGNRKVELRTLPIPHPGHGEVLLRVKASTICGSDIRCIYHEHLGKGPEGYQSGNSVSQISIVPHGNR
jgi:threonine dehydrogenase-like Zn-dependent dehydrogenase